MDSDKIIMAISISSFGVVALIYVIALLLK